MSTEEDRTTSKEDEGTRSGSWWRIIDAVKTPLGIFALYLLVCLAIVPIICLRLPPTEVSTLVWGVIGSTTFALLIVVYLGLRDPHLLLGVLEKESPEFRFVKPNCFNAKHVRKP
jgi:hypothetical protein